MRLTYPGLDIVRFLAAISVAAYHLGYFYDHQYPILSFGWVGVEVFFVLSGFVIAMSAESRKASDFVISRALRLYPAAIICSVAIAAFTFPGLMPFVRSILIWPVGSYVSGVFWTLPVEICFYLLIAISILCGWSRVSVAYGLVACSAVFWGARKLGVDLDFEPVSTMLGNMGALFALGILLYEKRFGLPIIAAFLLGLLEVVARAWFGGHPFWYLAPTVWTIAIVGILVSIRQQKWASPALRTLGLMTYPLYLLHDSYGLFVTRHLGLFAGLIVTCLLAFGVLPLEKILRRLLSPKRGHKVRSEEVSTLTQQG